MTQVETSMAGAEVRPFRVEVREGEQARLLRRQGRQRPGCGERLPQRALPGPTEPDRAGVSNLIYFNQVDKGNHFAAWQEPELFTTEVRAAFKSLR